MRGVVSRYSDAVDDLPAAPVPVDITLEPPATALLITGPNTGGKTVAIKTAGLLALMAQSGLHVPAEPGSALPVFRTIFADIGDEQSIAASLSTFSWHVRNIASMDRDLQRPALVLLDEIGAGTDPTEGGALGIAIVEHFRSRGALVLGTTHYDALKTYASTTAGVTCAAFGFDPDGFRPTLPAELRHAGSKSRARSRRTAWPGAVDHPDRASARGRQGRAAAGSPRRASTRGSGSFRRDRAAVERERQTLRTAEGDLHARESALREREEQFRRKLGQRLDERVREARREIDAVVDDLKKRTSVLVTRVTSQQSAPRLTTGDAGAARAQAQSAIDEVAQRLRADVDAPAPPVEAPPARPVAVGDRVAVGGFGLEGVIVSISGTHAEIDVRGKRMRAGVSDLRLVAGPARPANAAAPVRVNVTLQPRDGLLSELNVIGCSVDEAIDRTERFLDETLVTDQKTIRVVHGHGTGQLRRAIAALLKDHPQVASFHTAPSNQGGGGVTVVELKE